MSVRVLLIGGNGKIAKLMTPLMLAKSWNVISLIRDKSQSGDIEDLATNQPGKLDVLVSSLADVKSDSQADGILNQAKPDWVVWSAGAGGKGGPDNTCAIDRDAARHFVTASVKTKSIKKFLMVSYIGSRRNRPQWWSDKDWEDAQHVNDAVLPHYYQAKIEADECLTALARQRGNDFSAIVLRPGSLTQDATSGKVLLGHTPSRGSVSRGDVADVAVRLLERDDVRGWIDMLAGEEDTDQAIDRLVRENIDCVEGDDLNAMVQKYPLVA